MQKIQQIDKQVTIATAEAFFATTEIGCYVTERNGDMLHKKGFVCSDCLICRTLNRTDEICSLPNLKGFSESERFGGKYIYNCPLGFAYFASPILGEVSVVANIIVGPFLMVEKEEFLELELSEYNRLSKQQKEDIDRTLDAVPYISPSRVDKMSTLLFMATSFVGNLSESNRLRMLQESESIQSSISEYVLSSKKEKQKPYPLEIETALLQQIRKGNKQKSHELLNELLGHIFFLTSGNLTELKGRITQLLVLMGRAAVEVGTAPQWILEETNRGIVEIDGFNDWDRLCYWLSKRLTSLFTTIFTPENLRHKGAVSRCVNFIDTNYYDKISLDQLAGMVSLTPNHLSRIFHQDIGKTLVGYISEVRIEKSKALLIYGDLTLAEIALAVGFSDQSYYTKVFKRLVGVTPSEYRARV